MTKIRVLVVGTGGMAHAHVEAYATMRNVQVVGGVDPNPIRLQAFIEKHSILHGFGSIFEALAWGNFDAVSNVTPDGIHHQTTLPCLKAGKHVLCEKPLATCSSDALEMARAASEAGVVNMVNLTYRNGAAVVKAAQIVADGKIGEVRHFEASYLQSWLTQSAWGDWRTEEQWLWRLSKAHGSMGVLGDVGVHILDYTTFIAGADVASISSRLTTFDKAQGGVVRGYTLDANDSVNMHVRLKNGAVGVIHASRMASGHINDLSLRIFGTEGGLDVRFVNNQSLIKASLGDDMLCGHWVDISAKPVKSNFVRFIDAIRAGCFVEPNFTRGAVLQKALDAALQSDAEMSRDVVV